jgi:hypothetical protein
MKAIPLIGSTPSANLSLPSAAVEQLAQMAGALNSSSVLHTKIVKGWISISAGKACLDLQ